MNKWLLLGLAIFSEVIATSALKSTDGFTKFWPSALVVLGYTSAFYFVSLTLDTIPVGIVYAIWSGVGIALVAIISVTILGQKLDAGAVVGIVLILAGVVVLRLYSNTMEVFCVPDKGYDAVTIIQNMIL